MNGFLDSFEKWPVAVHEAFSSAQKYYKGGALTDVDFEFGPPSSGKCPCYVIADGHKMPLCEVSDCYPVLKKIRDWIERCLTFDKKGELNPQILTLDCYDTVLTIAMVQAGWYKCYEKDHARPISLFVVSRDDSREATLQCLCESHRTLRNLYWAILDVLTSNAKLFDSPGTWYSADRCCLLKRHRFSRQMLNSFLSHDIEIKTAWCSDKSSIDEKCQSPDIFLHD